MYDHLFGLRGVPVLPEGAMEHDQWFSSRVVGW